MAEENNLLPQIANGDNTAIDKVIKKYGGLIWTMARSWFSNNADAEDAVQDVYVDVWRSAGRFKPNMISEKSFITMITKRRLIDRLRRNERHSKVGGMTDAMDPGYKGDVDVENSTDAAIATEAMGNLRADQRKILRLFYEYGMSHGEIAEATSTAVGTVKTHIRRGVASMRSTIAANQPKSLRAIV